MPNHMLIGVSPKKSCTFAKSKNENVSPTRSDNVTSYPSVNPMALGYISNTFSQKTPSAISAYNTDFHTTYKIFRLCSFNGKEKDPESGFHYYGARYYWSELLTGWLSVDPMADKYPGISPYAYCAWNPAILVDPDGKKDRPFRDGDKHVHDIQGTATFIMTNLIGFMQVFSSYSILNTYHCHSYAWHGSWGDKNPASGDIPYDQYGITSLPRWDQNPADDIRDVINRGGRQLGSDEDNIIGDRVIYFTDHNENGMYDDGEFISHSAIVTAVDDKGYTIEVTGKMGQDGISINHPDAPGYYKASPDTNTGKIEKQSRAYFRMPSEN